MPNRVGAKPEPGTVGAGVLGGVVLRSWDQGLSLDDEKRRMEDPSIPLTSPR